MRYDKFIHLVSSPEEWSVSSERVVFFLGHQGRKKRGKHFNGKTKKKLPMWLIFF